MSKRLNTVFLIIAILFIQTDTKKKDIPIPTIVYDGVPARELYVELPDIRYIPDKVNVSREGGTFKPYKLTFNRMRLTSLGYYYITAYCPYECGGSWSTASGVTCHRADYDHRLTEPTTCAISRSIHSFGEEFYLPDFDRTFIAEDTGSAVRGYHLDLFYEDYADVLSFPTGYYEVFAVEWEEIEVIVTEEDHACLESLPPTEYYRKEVYEE